MLHIILSILKIIGIILLIVLGLLLFGVICILFVPVRYKGKGEWYKEKHGKVVVSWLLHIVSIHITYNNGESDIGFRIFGIRLRRRNKKAPKNKSIKNKRANKSIKNKRANKSIKNETLKNNQAEISSEIREPKSQTITLTDIPKEPARRLIVDETTSGKKKEKKKWKSPFEIIRNIRFKINSIYDKLKKINEKKNNVLAFLRDDDTKLAWKKVKKELIKLLKYILPTRLKLYMKFGFEDPATTGRTLGIIYMFYGFTKRFQIYPDFQNKVFEGEAEFKGRIRGIRLLVVFLKLWFNQRVRSTIERAKQL